MATTDHCAISAIRKARHQLSGLVQNDTETLIQIGADLEAVLGQMPEAAPIALETLNLCLVGLQTIFEGNAKDFNSLIVILTATMASLEHDLGAPENPITPKMLDHTVSLLKTELGLDEVAAAKPEPRQERSNTIDEVGELLVSGDPSDIISMTQIRESLKSIAAGEKSVERRKLLVKAAREVDRIVKGDTINVNETLASVASLIDGSNDIHRSQNPSLYDQHLDSDASETGTNIQPVMESSIKPLIMEALKPDFLAGDTDLALVSEFVVESGEMLEAAEGALLELETDLDNIENVNTIFRAFHTIKGTSAYLGLQRIAGLAHLAESLLSRMRDREIKCSGGYANLVLQSIDVLNEMLNGLREVREGGEIRTPSSYANLINFLSKPEEFNISDEAIQIAELVSSKIADSDGKTDEQIREGTRLGDILIDMKKISQEQINSVITSKGSVLLGTMLVKKGLVTAKDIADALAIQKKLRSPKKQQSVESTVRVRTERLDQLIDIVGELVIAQSMLSQDATLKHGGYQELSRKISHTGKIVRELQDLSMGMRMVPLKSTFQKMSRLVRDVANKCGKHVEFVTEGEDTEIDRNMVDLIADPLVHMVRNAVDHGIEKPDVRAAAGKHRSGTISLSAYHSGGDVVVELTDDGAGIDKDVILAKALSKNLIESEKCMTEDQIFNLLFAPGFSTAEQVTDVSGRGVGMDVVRRNLEEMRGRVSITSEKGKGATFIIRLPLTLAITDGMLIRVGNERFIIPIVNIHLSFQPRAEMLTKVAGRGELVSLRGELMPVFRLHRLFDVSDAVENPTEGLLMIVADGRRRCALLVDEILGQQQVVAKNLGQGTGKSPGVSGGAILGDGCVGVILDTPEIVALARRNTGSKMRKDEVLNLQAA